MNTSMLERALGSQLSSYNTSQNGGEDSSELCDSLLFESNGLSQMGNTPEDDEAMEKKKYVQNKNLTKIEFEIYQSIRYGDHEKLKDLGAAE